MVSFARVAGMVSAAGKTRKEQPMTSRFTDHLVTVFTAGFFAGATLAFLAQLAGGRIAAIW